MKKIECLRKFQSPPLSCSLFLIFFFIYLLVGLYLVNFNPLVLDVELDLIYNFDTGYRFLYMYKNPAAFHTVVHPISSITSLLVSFFKAILSSSSLSLIVIQSLCASGIVCIFNSILKKIFYDNKALISFFTLIVGFSYTILILAAIPETYIYVGLVQSLFIYYIISLVLDDNIKELKNTQIVVIALLSVYVFSLNLFNSLYSLILIIYLLFVVYKNNLKLITIAFLKIFTIFSIFLLILVPLQSNAYNVKSFANPIAKHILKKEEHPGAKYFNKYKTSERFNLLLKGALIQPMYAMKSGKSGWRFYSRHIVTHEKIKTKHWIFYQNQKLVRYIPFILFALLPLFWFFKAIKDDSFKRFAPLILPNVILYLIASYYYEVLNSFIYAQNCFCCLMLFFAFLYKFVPRKLMIATCSSFIVYQIFTNIRAIYKIKQFLAKNSDYNILDVIFYAVILFFIFALICYILKRLINERIFSLCLDCKYIFYLGGYLILFVIHLIFLILSNKCV